MAGRSSRIGAVDNHSGAERPDEGKGTIQGGMTLTSNDGISELIRLSRYAGERFDLVQAGGGNSSLKSDDHRMWIKRSGISLSDVVSQHQFCLVDWAEI